MEVPSARMEARCCLIRAGGAYGICGCPLHPHMQKIEGHGSLTMASLFMLPQEKIDYVTDRLFLTLGKLIPPVDQMLLFSGEVRVLPFLKELSKRNSQSITKQREC